MKLFEKTINSTSVFDGRILHITLDYVELDDGKKSKREVVNHPGGVTVAALDNDNNLLFVRRTGIFLYFTRSALSVTRLHQRDNSSLCMQNKERG